MSIETSGIGDWLDRVRPDRETLLLVLVIVNTELLLVGLYWLTSGTRFTSLWSLRFWLYPFVWINVGAWAILRTVPAPANARQRTVAAAIAVAYFGVLAYVGGLVGPAASAPGRTLDVTLLGVPPGWGPAVLYNGAVVAVALVPFRLVGYAALSYLVYATVLDATRSAVTGVLGLLSCVSCTWPVLASLATGIFGSTSAIAGAVYTQSYGLSTLVFVVTVGLLYWRPFGE